jgi:hypothetical protein
MLAAGTDAWALIDESRIKAARRLQGALTGAGGTLELDRRLGAANRSGTTGVGR